MVAGGFPLLGSYEVTAVDVRGQLAAVGRLLPMSALLLRGDEDTDAVAMVMPSSELSEGLAERRVTHRVIRGVDHEGLNARLEVAWPEASAWLSGQLARDVAR